MAAPQPLSALVEENGMELEGKWRAALADGHVSHEEAIDIYRFERTTYQPDVMRLTVTVGVIGTMVSGSEGVYSPRVRRTCRELWQRVDNVVPFRRKSGPDLPPAA